MLGLLSNLDENLINATHAQLYLYNSMFANVKKFKNNFYLNWLLLK